jgi:hypothetical protein
MQFTALSTLAIADVPETRLSGANTLFSMVQQISLSMGIAIGAIVLRAAMELRGVVEVSEPVLADFHMAFVVIGFLPLLAMIDVLGLAREPGATISRHVPRTSARQ